MRSNLELWEIVRDNFDEYFRFGLCSAIDWMFMSDIINKYELNKLNHEISYYGSSQKYFLGERSDPKPRKEFIEKMIKKHKILCKPLK